jgi:hypothetical protein
LPSQKTYFSPLVDDRLIRLIRLRRQFGRVNFQVQTLEALHPGDEF